MMPRYVAKTYGRNASKDNYASKAFDDLLTDNRGASTTKAAATAKAATKGSKWGNTSFTSTRTTSLTPTPIDDTEPKKRKVVESEPIQLFDDPFSFDEGGPMKSRKTDKRASPLTISQKQPKNVVKPVAMTSAAVDADDDDYIPVRKQAIKTYGGGKSSNKNGSTKTVIKPLGLTSTVSKAQTDRGSSSSSSSNNNRTQITIDNNTQKMPVLTISRDRLKVHNQQTSNSQPLKKKFFVTSPTKSVDEDHNYSHREQSSTRDSSQDSKLFESDYEDSGDDELESGDPEIIFNSPKKRALGEAVISEPLAQVSDDNDTLPDEDIGRVSPFSISDDEDSLPSRSSSQRSEPTARYTASYSVNKHTLVLTKANSTGTRVLPAPVPVKPSEAIYERKPIFTYSRKKPKEATTSNSSQPSNSSQQSRTSSLARLSSSDLDQDSLLGRLKPDRNARADSPASVGSASSGTSTSSANQRSLKLTYSRKSRSDPSKMAPDSKQLVRKLLTSPKKSVAVYNPRPWSSKDGKQTQDSDDDEPSTGNKPPASVATSGAAAAASAVFGDFDADEDFRPTMTQPKFRRRVTMPEQVWPDQEPIPTLRVTKEHKPLFTVVRNVKQAHECQEHGETQEFEDDIDYILDGLQTSQKETLRCLSTISLVTKSAIPAFRMHLRAHGTIAKIYSALQDAPEYPTLALCTAGVMFMLSRDRLNMELDKTSLQLMLNLLSVDGKIPTERGAVAEYNRMKKRIQAICESLNIDGKARQFHLDLIDISPGKLAMESLLSLTSRKAGDWFKEDLRELGGLDRIVSTVSKCSDSLDEVEIEPTPAMLNTLKKIERCLRVLENVTMMNTENQNHLLHHNDSELTVAVCMALRVCENCQPFNPVELDSDGTLDKEGTGYIVFSCMLAVLRVLLNLTHDNEYGCRAVGQQPGIITTLLRCILQVPQYISIEQRFDLLVLSLGLLINMIEHSEANRQILAEETTQGHYDSQSSSTQIPATTALTQFFVARFDAAERLEAEQALDHEQLKKEKDKKTDSTTGQDPNASGQWHESESGLEWVVIPEDERGENGRETGIVDLDEVMSQSSNGDDNLDLLPGSQEEDENFTKALHKAGRHMEDSIVAAYVSLLIGVILQNNTDLVDDIKDEVPGGTFDPMIKMLKKFLGFMNFTSSVSNGGKSIIRVIHTLESC